MDNGHTRKSPKFLFVLTFIFSVICGLCFRNANVSALTIVSRNNFSHFEYNKGMSNFSLYEINKNNGGKNLIRQYNTNGAFVENIKYNNGRLLVRTQEGDMCFLETKTTAEPSSSKACSGMSFGSDTKNSAGSSNSSSTNTNTNTGTTTATSNNATNTNKGSSTTTSTTNDTSKKANTNNNSSSKSSGSGNNSSNNSSSNQSKVDTGASGPSGAVESDVCKQANIPEAVKLAAGCSVTVDGEQKTAPNIQNVIMGIINGVIAVLGIICVAVIIYGGIRYMTSVGEQEKVKKAKNTILYAVIGLAICALSFAITNFVVGVLNGEASTSTSQSNSSNSKDAGNSNSGSKKEKKNSSSDSNKEDNNESNSDDNSASDSDSINEIFVSPKFDIRKNDIHVYTDEKGKVMAIEMQGIKSYHDFGVLLDILSIEGDDENAYILAVSSEADLIIEIYPTVKNGEILIGTKSCENKTGECTVRGEFGNTEETKATEKNEKPDLNNVDLETDPTAVKMLADEIGDAIAETALKTFSTVIGKPNTTKTKDETNTKNEKVDEKYSAAQKKLINKVNELAWPYEGTIGERKKQAAAAPTTAYTNAASAVGITNGVENEEFYRTKLKTGEYEWTKYLSVEHKDSEFYVRDQDVTYHQCRLEGQSCAMFVGTVFRSSGVDKKMGNHPELIYERVKSSSNFEEIKDVKDVKGGDIVVFIKKEKDANNIKDVARHVEIITEVNGKLYTAKGSVCAYWPFIYHKNVIAEKDIDLNVNEKLKYYRYIK